MTTGSKKSESKIADEFKDLAPSPEGPEDETDRAIIRMTKEGKKYREIQKELGVGQARIAMVLKNAGVSREQRRREEVKKTMLLFDDELTGSFIEIPFDYFAKRYGDFWRLSPEEKKKLSSLTNKVASKWLPLWLERYGDEVALAFTFGMMVYPRYLQTKELVEKAKLETEKPKIEPLPTP
jgi:hypothetical protein